MVKTDPALMTTMNRRPTATPPDQPVTQLTVPSATAAVQQQPAHAKTKMRPRTLNAYLLG